MRSPWNGLLVTVRTLALFLVVGLMAAACTAEDEVPRLERRAQAINSGIMCPVCPGESIDQSQHPLSVQMRAIVIEKLEQGWTGEEVRDFFVERYGPGVLLEPSREGANLLVWLVPPVGLALAGVLLFAVLRGMVRSQPGDGEEAIRSIELSPEERAVYSRRIEATLTDEGLGEGMKGVDRSPGPEVGGIP